MTDKEKAEEYVNCIIKKQIYCLYSCYDCERLHDINEHFGIGENEMLRIVEKTFLDGLAEGRKELQGQISRMRNCFNCDNILDCGQYDTERINYGGCDNWKMIED